jgi:hypothetical protein
VLRLCVAEHYAASIPTALAPHLMIDKKIFFNLAQTETVYFIFQVREDQVGKAMAPYNKGLSIIFPQNNKGHPCNRN